ncbi:hypothetical protein Tco_0111207 [Tanacetum coccineum]
MEMGRNIPMGLLNTVTRNCMRLDSIWVIVDRLIKSAHFSAIVERLQDRMRLARLYINEIVSRHGVIKVLLNVSPRKGVVHFGKRSKLSPRYVGPSKIVERVGPVAYWLRLPHELVGVHDTFHVSNLKKCLAEVNLHVPLEEVKIDDKLHSVESL